MEHLMRYSVQRYGSWAWLDLDAPIQTSGPEWVLSSYGIMEGTVSPQQGISVAEDGRPVYEEWGTLIHAESGDAVDSRRWTGIVVDSRVEGSKWRLKVFEFPGYLHDLPLETLIRGVGTDPAELIRQVWLNVQAWPSSWLNVSVTGTTPLRIGSDSTDKAALARAAMDARKSTLDTFSKTKAEKTRDLQDLSKTLADEVAIARAQVTLAQEAVLSLTRDKAPTEQIEQAKEVLSSRQTLLMTLLAAYKAETDAAKTAVSDAKTSRSSAEKAFEKSKASYDKAVELAEADGGAFEIRPDDVMTAQKVVADLCSMAGIEWTTRTIYSDDVPQLYIDIHYPTAGARRNDLVFQQGLNIASVLSLTRSGEYANAGVGIGAGEGVDAVRAAVENSSSRLRRTLVVEDRSIKKASQLATRVRNKVRKHSGDLFVPEIEIIDTPLAPIFSWQVGDLILVQGSIPHYGAIEQWHRIRSWSLKGRRRALLRLEIP